MALDGTSKTIATEAWSELVHSIMSWSPPSDMSMEYYYTLPEEKSNSNRLDIYKYKLGTKNIEARIRSGLHSQVVQPNEDEDQQGIEYIQDRIRSTNNYYAMKANERENQQGIENVQDCMRSTNDYYVVQPNEDENQQQGIEHIQPCIRSSNHYDVVQVNEYENQQVMEHTQHSTAGSTVLFKPPKYEEHHQSINNIREFVRSQGLPKLLEQRDLGDQQRINHEKLKKMSTLFDDLLEFIENRNMHLVEKPTLRFQVLEVIKLLHHYGIDTIRSGVEEELEYVNKRNDAMDKNSATHYIKNALEVMLRVCDTEKCQSTIYEIIGKAEKDQMFFEW